MATQRARSRKKRPARGPGRPAQQGKAAEDVKRGLVEAARDLFARRGFADVGIRELSDAAGVTPGMISYYFGGKQGLFEAMFASVFDTVLERVSELAAQPSESTAPLEGLLRLYSATLAATPWLPGLMLREVLTGDEGARARFAERFASRFANLLPALVTSEIASGALRRDLDPRLTILALIGASVFPFLAFPILGKVLGYELDDAFAKKLAAHNTSLFLDGARPRAKATA